MVPTNVESDENAQIPAQLNQSTTTQSACHNKKYAAQLMQ